MITVLYDGKCGLCNGEINYYKRIAEDGIFDWCDITESADALEKAGISLVQGLKQIHVIDNDHKVHMGVYAFIVIWKNLKWWSILAKFVELPIIVNIADLIYKKFANWRFNKLEHCQIAVNQENKIK